MSLLLQVTNAQGSEPRLSPTALTPSLHPSWDVTQQQQQQWLYSNIDNSNNSSDCQLYNNIGTHVQTMYIMWSVSSHVLTICKDKWQYWLCHLCMCLSIILSLSPEGEWFNICKNIKKVLLMFLQTFLLCDWPFFDYCWHFRILSKILFLLMLLLRRGEVRDVSRVAHNIMCCVNHLYPGSRGMLLYPKLSA